ncbi:hypothetical protein D9758_014840 [Tetrapyrgos nigripes]|uniref:Uncharacterized protein n=1 Tax=Tetrapyrgos nigripes TaxID=182062 RepID=A0A8H5CUP2_9AGAR|nr:hypothetical protein D9758_014840 [Tetrapyrgos nigripes]
MIHHASTSRFRNILYILTVGAFLLFLCSEHLNSFTNYTYIYTTNGDGDTNSLNTTSQNFEQEMPDYASEPVPPPLSPEELEIQKYSPYCPPDRCAHGHWVPRVPPFQTYEEADRWINVYHKDGLDPGLRLPDPEPEPVPVSGVRITEEQKKDRYLEMSNWVWESEFGKVVPFDAEELVVRLLKSAGGLFLVGDSLTIHWLYTVHHRIYQAGLKLEEYHEGPLQYEGLAPQYRLDMNHPPCQELVQRAGIPLERAYRPILTHIVAQSLVTPDELKKIFRADWAYVHHHHYFTVNNWEVALAELTKEVDGERARGVNEDSLVVVSNGAHWSRVRLRGYVEETTDYEGFRRRIEHGYSEMIKVVMGNLAPLPHTTLFFRSISPGHPLCPQFPVPFSSMHDAEDWSLQPGHEKPDPEEWDWDMFPERNDKWRQAIRKYEESRLESSDGLWNGRGNKWIYLDFWSMDFQRIDAHTGYWDCLHYALPFEHNQWTDMLFHRLVVESRLTERDMESLDY